MDIIALKEKCIIGLYYQYVGVANVLVLSPVQWSPANPRLAPTCAVSNVGTPGVLTNNQSVYAIFPFFASILESFLTIAFLKVILLHYCCSVVARVLLFGEVMQVFYDWNLGSINCAS